MQRSDSWETTVYFALRWSQKTAEVGNSAIKLMKAAGGIESSGFWHLHILYHNSLCSIWHLSHMQCTASCQEKRGEMEEVRPGTRRLLIDKETCGNKFLGTSIFLFVRGVWLVEFECLSTATAAAVDDVHRNCTTDKTLHSYFCSTLRAIKY